MGRRKRYPTRAEIYKTAWEIRNIGYYDFGTGLNRRWHLPWSEQRLNPPAKSWRVPRVSDADLPIGVLQRLTEGDYERPD